MAVLMMTTTATMIIWFWSRTDTSADTKVSEKRTEGVGQSETSLTGPVPRTFLSLTLHIFLRFSAPPFQPWRCKQDISPKCWYWHGSKRYVISSSVKESTFQGATLAFTWRHWGKLRKISECRGSGQESSWKRSNKHYTMTFDIMDRTVCTVSEFCRWEVSQV
jgi:hypothetical protein